MAQLLGDRFLPESVTSMRQSFRSRVSDLREPIRSRREELVPGPDVVGRVEEQFSNLRTRFVRRNSLMERIRSQSEGDSGSGSGNGTSGNGSSSEMV